MAKKKSVKRSLSKKSSEKKTNSGKSSLYGEKKFRVVIHNLILFTVLFLSFLFLYSISSSEVFYNLFWVLALLAGFVDVAFVIAFLILIILRFLNSK